MFAQLFPVKVQKQREMSAQKDFAIFLGPLESFSCGTANLNSLWRRQKSLRYGGRQGAYFFPMKFAESTRPPAGPEIRFFASKNRQKMESGTGLTFGIVLVSVARIVRKNTVKTWKISTEKRIMEQIFPFPMRSTSAFFAWFSP